MPTLCRVHSHSQVPKAVFHSETGGAVSGKLLKEASLGAFRLPWLCHQSRFITPLIWCKAHVIPTAEEDFFTPPLHHPLQSPQHSSRRGETHTGIPTMTDDLEGDREREREGTEELERHSTNSRVQGLRNPHIFVKTGHMTHVRIQPEEKISRTLCLKMSSDTLPHLFIQNNTLFIHSIEPHSTVKTPLQISKNEITLEVTWLYYAIKKCFASKKQYCRVLGQIWKMVLS